MVIKTCLAGCPSWSSWCHRVGPPIAPRDGRTSSRGSSRRGGVQAAMVDSETVIAIGFFDDGGLSIVTGGKRW